MKSLHKRIAIVTGASRLNGIGAAICHKLAESGADIFFTYWSPYDKQMPWGSEDKEPEQLKKAIVEKGVRCAFMELDLTQLKSVDALFDAVEKELGHPSILINNAAYSTETTIETITAEELDKHYQVNVRATMMLSMEFAKRFNKGVGGRIINMSSGQSLGPMPGEIAYAATKGAVEALTLTLSAEVGQKGITVNAVNPGPTDTGWMNKEIQKDLVPMFPFGRVGKPSDAANIINFLASDEAAWITGQVIHSEGGFKR